MVRLNEGLCVEGKKISRFWIIIPVFSAVLWSNFQFQQDGDSGDQNRQISAEFFCSPEETREFPGTLKPQMERFEIWSRENVRENVWAVHPERAEEIVRLANWAAKYSWKIRPSGVMHSWSPLTLDLEKTKSGKQMSPCSRSSSCQCLSNSSRGTEEGVEKPKKVDRGSILVKTDKLTGIGIISKEPGNFLFWTEPGVTIENMLTYLQGHGMGFLHAPAIGEVTIAGVLAVGGHGTGVPAVNETRKPGHTFGALSNLIVSLSAVVYDEKNKKYDLKTFDRRDPDIRPFLTSFGRTFVTNVTLRAGPRQHLRVQSMLDISADELFIDPIRSTGSNLRSLASFLDSSGRLEVMLWAYETNAWLKVWSVVEDDLSSDTEVLEIDLDLDMDLDLKNHTRSTSKLPLVDGPYNYPFSHGYSWLSMEILQKSQENFGFLSQFIGPISYWFVRFNIFIAQTWDLFGTSKDLQLYAQSSTARLHINGYAIISKREDVQKVLHQSYQIYTNLLEEYQTKGLYPVNGLLEVRVSGLDDPADALLENAQIPVLSSSSPITDRPDLDTAVWFNVLTFPNTPFKNQFMKELEERFLQNFDGWAVLRPEWCKGWGYSKEEPWGKQDFFKTVIARGYKIEDWREMSDIFHKYDPSGIYTNDFLKEKLFL